MTERYASAVQAFALWLDQVREQISEPVTFAEALPRWRNGLTVSEAVDEIQTDRRVLYDLEEGA